MNTEVNRLSLNLPNIEDVIDRYPLTVTPDTTVLDAIALMSQPRSSRNTLPSLNPTPDVTSVSQERASCISVVEGLQLIGIFTERDVVKLTFSGMDLSQIKIAEVMTRRVITLVQSNIRDIFTVLLLLRQYRIRHLPVVDDEGQLVGMITPNSIRQVLQPADLLKWRCVGEVMQTQVTHAPATASVLSVVQLMAEHRVSCVVIMEETQGKIVPLGMITERDIVQFQVLGLDIAQTQALTVMSTPLFCLKSSDSLWVAHQEMQQRHVQRLVVAGEQGELRGIVTQTIILQVLDPLEMSGVIAVLQQSVAAQTLELRQTNQQLQQEVVQRQQVELALRQANDELETRVAQRTAELSQSNRLLQQQIERERLVTTIAQHIRQSLNMEEVLNTTVAEVRQFLQVERVFIYRFEPDYSGVVVVESVDDGCMSILNVKVQDTYLMETRGEKYRQGRIQAVADIYTAGLTKCHCDLLVQLQIRANLAVPILQGENLWGLLVANQCSASRQWQQLEVDLLKQLATQVGIAIQQSELYQQLEAELTERRRAQAQIREQAALLDVATDAICVRNLQQQILFWNQGAERLYGFSAAEALGKNAHKLLCPQMSSQVAEAIKTVVESGSWQGDLEKVTKSGKKVIVECRWSLVRDAAGQPKSILTVDTDITEKKYLEQQFLRTQRLESLGTLASGIAHDLNNILTPVLTSAQLLVLKLPHLDEQNGRLLKIVEDSSKRAADLVKQILIFARGSEGRRIPLQIGHLLNEIEQIANSTFPKSIEISTNTSTQTLGMILADPTQMHQVLMNLCVNARDAMPNGGKLHISAQNFFIDQNFARMNLDAQVGAYVVITVSDTGFGIPPEILERIFEPFFTTKEPGKGTGLGLSTVIGIVKSHGGFVKVYSEVGKGSQFQVYLPTVEKKAEQRSPDWELVNGNGELILVVDDEPLILEITQTSLSDYNYRVLTVSDGIEAIAMYPQYQDEINVVLMDMMMPSMDGLTAIRTLRRINPQVKIIATSGLASNSQFAKAAGANAFLRKPYTVKELLQAVAREQTED